MPRPLPEKAVDTNEEQPVSRRPRRPGAFVLTVLGLGLALFLLWDMRADVAFWIGSPPLTDLGVEGAYHLDRAADGALARIAGKPGSSATRFSRYGRRYEIVAVRGTHILVRRALKGSEARTGAAVPPPAQVTFVAEGRLAKDSSIPEYGEAFRLLVERGDAEPRGGHLYVLLDGERPRTGWRVPLAVIGLGLLVGLNLFSLTRSLCRAMGRRRTAPGAERE
ncbi:MAG: hypothetical protein ACOX6T_15840 [Myxococcales bacterium]|jgi:hypothetical protein